MQLVTLWFYISVTSPTLLVYRANAQSAKSVAAVTASLVDHLHHLVDELPCSILKCATSAVISELRWLCLHAVCNAMLHFGHTHKQITVKDIITNS
jgi:hypothetical protein